MEKNIDTFRRWHLAISELIDAWRIIPRLLVLGYGFLLYKTVMWYMSLEAYIPKELLNLKKDMTPEQLQMFLQQAPTTQHAVLVTAVISIAAAIFGLYTSTGRKWNGFTSWSKDKKKAEADDEQSS